ncbi:MAG TPA: right-handed parallel beta-helix repeat-containing protein, partial [Kiritimatiellia bacterium]
MATVYLFLGICAHSAELVVAKKGATPFKTIQSALDTAAPGDTITVEAGVYAERIAFSKSGNEEQGWITLRAAPGAKVELDGRRGFAKHIVDIQERQYVRFIGFDISKNLGVRDSAGIHVGGPCQHVEIISNTVHETRGTRATGIMVENTDAAPASFIIVQGNTVYDVQPAPSGAITVSGNVTDWLVADNVVHDANDAGIRIECGAVAAEAAVRNGVCRGNRVARSRAVQGDGYVPGIHIDGAKDSVIEGNIVSECDRGLEIGAETTGRDASGLAVRDNILFGNSKSGLVFG